LHDRPISARSDPGAIDRLAESNLLVDLAPISRTSSELFGIESEMRHCGGIRSLVKLDITSFANAVRRLREGLVRYERDATDEQIRDGLIQRFEFTYELSHKVLRRFLKEIAASPDEIDRLPFAVLIRTGSAQGLLRGDWTAWRGFREMCARTRHTRTIPK